MAKKKLSEMSPEERQEYWNSYAATNLLGKKIVHAAYMTEEDAENCGFTSKALILTLDDGTLIFPSADDEGNDAGALFGMSAKDEHLTFPVL